RPELLRPVRFRTGHGEGGGARRRAGLAACLKILGNSPQPRKAHHQTGSSAPRALPIARRSGTASAAPGGSTVLIHPSRELRLNRSIRTSFDLRRETLAQTRVRASDLEQSGRHSAFAPGKGEPARRLTG